jgi:alpha-glucosidase
MIEGHAMYRRGLLLAAFLLGLVPIARADDLTQAPAPRLVVRPVLDDLRTRLKLDPFYEKATDYKGLPILASGKVSDRGLAEARYLIGQMLGDRDDITEAMVKARCRFVVMAPTEMTTDVPEQRNMTPKDYWDNRARGLGGRITSCGEENLLNLKGDRYRNENILIHEFSHCIHQYGLRTVDPKFDGKLRSAYTRSIDKGLWKDTYAATNQGEYWAEGVQSYFDCNAPPNKGIHNDINTREKLAKYDTEFFALIDDVFKQSQFRYVRYDKRNGPQK